MKVKDLIKELSDFNPNAEIRENIDICWTGDDCAGERDIEQEKLDTELISLCCSGDSDR